MRAGTDPGKAGDQPEEGGSTADSPVSTPGLELERPFRGLRNAADLAWSSDGALFGAINDSGEVKVWSESDHYILSPARKRSMIPDDFCLAWHPSKPVLATASGDQLNLYDMNSSTSRVIHVRRLFGNKMRLIQFQVSVSTYCYHPGSNGPGSEKPSIDPAFA